MSALCNKGEVDILQACGSSTGGIQYLACDGVFREAVDVERGAPFCRVATNTTSLREKCPTWGIELHLHERYAWVTWADRGINDVGIAVGLAVREQFGEGLCVAHRHAEPERRVQFKVEGFAWRRRCRWRRVLGECELIPHPI